MNFNILWLVKLTKLAAWLFVGFFGLCVTSCWSPPGQGAKARAGYKGAASIILALEEFHGFQGNYPSNLNDLVPAYLPREALILPRGLYSGPEPIAPPTSNTHMEEMDGQHTFSYERNGNGYTVGFEYIGPGENYCEYDSIAKAWHSAGHY